MSSGLDIFDGHRCDDGRGRRFTNTAVPRFDGTGCWQQHLLIFQAIVKSNGWSPPTATLQLFAHLDGEALNVSLLMPVEEREQWTDLANGLSEYYNAAFIASGKYGVSHFQVSQFTSGVCSCAFSLQTRQQNGGQNYFAFSGRIFAKK